MDKTIFERIIAREVPADIIYEDEDCLAITDQNPQAPTHVLVMPKRHIARLSDAEDNDRQLLGHLVYAATQIADQLGVADAYRLVINNGASAGQSVYHLHVHMLAGRTFSWPPG